MDKTMELSFFMRNPQMTSLYLASRTQMFQFPLAPSNQIRAYLLLPALLYATLNGPRGFGPPPKKKRKKSKTGHDDDDGDDDDDDEEEEEEEELEPDAGIIPEVVTNRMMNRMGFTVGVPVFIGLLFFPFFYYYLKVVLKIDVPTWVPFIVSFIFFGTALLGVSYGIVSSSSDPMREGSLLGWNEARKNWPVFWESFRGGSRK